MCKNGQHNFVIISSQGCDNEAKVVRWCRDCGGIVVDLDYDGRINPGYYMQMRFPKSHGFHRSAQSGREESPDTIEHDSG